MQQTLNNDFRKITGIITAILKSSGKTKDREWTRYGIIIGGLEYSGFEGSFSELKDLKQDQNITLIYKINGHFKNIVEINPKSAEELKKEEKETLDKLSPKIKKQIKVVEEMMEKTGKKANEWTKDQEKEVWRNLR